MVVAHLGADTGIGRSDGCLGITGIKLTISQECNQAIKIVT